MAHYVHEKYKIGEAGIVVLSITEITISFRSSMNYVDISSCKLK